MGAPDEFHEDVHPDAREITGDRQYGEWGQCVATAKSTGERCRGYAQGSHGKCGTHGGSGDSGAPKGNDNAAGNDGGASEDNTNAVTHGLYAKTNRFYQQVLDDDLRELADTIFEDYYELYQSRHGDVPMGHEARLFEIAVNHTKVIHADNWVLDKPDELDANNPMVDREERIKTSGEERPVTEVRYSETVIVGTQQKLRREDRQWLKDLGLLDDPESQGADAMGSLAEAIKRAKGDQ